MKRFLKIFLIITAMVLTVCCFASCGNAASNPDSASGEWENISWSYSKDTHVLSISGSGKMPDAASAAELPWASVRGAVTEVKVGEGVSAIGDYAFYSMKKLEKVSIAEGVETLGVCSFAFCSSLEDVKLPTSLTKLGESTFEGCAALNEITVPANVSDIGERAFAFCRNLSALTVEGKPAQIKSWTFKDCVKLESFRMDTVGVSLDDAAFEGAAIAKDGIKSLHTSLVSIVCKDGDGNEIKTEAGVAVLEIGESRELSAPAIDGYELNDVEKKTATGTGEAINVEFSYKKASEEKSTDAPAATEQVTTPDADKGEDKNMVTTVIAIVIFAVVLIAIAVGAVLLIRSDKNTTKDSMTVRKNKGDNTKKGKK